MSQQFLVTVSNPDYADEIANPQFRQVLQNALVKALPYDYDVHIERYDPENQRDDLSKIQAIKRIRRAGYVSHRFEIPDGHGGNTWRVQVDERPNLLLRSAGIPRRH